MPPLFYLLMVPKIQALNHATKYEALIMPPLFYLLMVPKIQALNYAPFEDDKMAGMRNIPGHMSDKNIQAATHI